MYKLFVQHKHSALRKEKNNFCIYNIVEMFSIYRSLLLEIALHLATTTPDGKQYKLVQIDNVGGHQSTM